MIDRDLARAFAERTLRGEVNDWVTHAKRNAEAVVAVISEDDPVRADLVELLNVANLLNERIVEVRNNEFQVRVRLDERWHGVAWRAGWVPRSDFQTQSERSVMATYSVSFSAPGKTLLEAVNNPANWGSVTTGVNPGAVGALKQAIVYAIKALDPTDNAPSSQNPSQLHATSLTVTASINTSMHTVSVVVS